MKPLNFEGSGSEYFKIWIVNILLIICTLGLYYPWAKVRKQRYLYANSTFEGRNFEYHATGKQLFFGYIIAMASFIIFLILQGVSPIAGSVVLLLFFMATPWIIWRSLQFNARMTSFSNVRLGFNGTLGAAFINFLLLPLALLIAVYVVPIAAAVGIPMLGDSLGAAAWLLGVIIGIAVVLIAFYLFAYLKKRNASYLMNGYRYGQGVFAAELETKPFLKITLKTVGLAIIGMILAIGIIVAAVYSAGMANEIMALQESMKDTDTMQEGFSVGLAVAVGLAYAALILVMLLVSAYSYTRQRAYSFANVKLDQEVTFASTLKARTLGFVMMTNLLLVVFTFGLATPWATVRMIR
ncbi:MAG: YjgN family protein, partial [Sinobacterium sp.]